MYAIYYGNFLAFRGNQLPLLHMDTDSFFLSIKTEDLIKDLEYIEDNFDFSELDKPHELYDCKSKKVIGQLKIETSL